ncbi:hypothetical protein NQZ68_022043, partial [Dissostichus eleginoides]
RRVRLRHIDLSMKAERRTLGQILQHLCGGKRVSGSDQHLHLSVSGVAGLILAAFTSLGEHRGHGGGTVRRCAKTSSGVSSSFLLRHFVLVLPLQFVPVVLEPYLHLVGAQVDESGQVFPLRRGQRRSSSYTCACEKSTRRFLRGFACMVTMDLLQGSMPDKLLTIPDMFIPPEGFMNLET